MSVSVVIVVKLIFALCTAEGLAVLPLDELGVTYGAFYFGPDLCLLVCPVEPLPLFRLLSHTCLLIKGRTRSCRRLKIKIICKE